MTENIIFRSGIANAKPGSGFLVAVLTFAATGTITAVWANPFFTRMTAVGWWELPALFVVALLAGVFTAIRTPACGAKRAGLGGFASFLGIACPTCNKILMLIFGGEALLRWFDPVRPAVTVIGMGLLMFAIRTEWLKQQLSVSTASLAGEV